MQLRWSLLPVFSLRKLKLGRTVMNKIRSTLSYYTLTYLTQLNTDEHDQFTVLYYLNAHGNRQLLELVEFI